MAALDRVRELALLGVLLFLFLLVMLYIAFDAARDKDKK